MHARLTAHTVFGVSTTMSEQQWQSGLARVRMVVGWVGRGGASTCVGVDPEDPRGLSPVAVRRLVYQCAAEMVKLPATFANTHMVRLGEVDGRQRVRCPIFTEAGKSQLALDLLVGCDAYGDPSVDLERVVDTRTGLVLLTEHEAPARDCPKRGQPVPGTGEDPRTRRDARIDDSNLVDQICGRIEQAHGNTGINSSQASTGQQDIAKNIGP